MFLKFLHTWILIWVVLGILSGIGYGVYWVGSRWLASLYVWLSWDLNGVTAFYVGVALLISAFWAVLIISWDVDVK